jgi:hypothetical protein
MSGQQGLVRLWRIQIALKVPRIGVEDATKTIKAQQPQPGFFC